MIEERVDEGGKREKHKWNEEKEFTKIFISLSFITISDISKTFSLKVLIFVSSPKSKGKIRRFADVFYILNEVFGLS